MWYIRIVGNGAAEEEFSAFALRGLRFGKVYFFFFFLMKQTVNFYAFERAFKESGRGNQFSYEGKQALFDYLEDYGEETGQEVELDVIALCCEFTEYENLGEFQKEYDAEKYETIDDIEDYTFVIRIPDSDGFIIQSF